MPIAALVAVRRGAFVLAVTLAPVALFAFMFGLDLPLASAAFWRLPKGDMAIMTAAYDAFVQQPWGWPITSVLGVSAQPVSIVYTDSIPWLSLALKALGLGQLFNPLGLFLLISYPLQAWGAVALLRALGVDRLGVLVLGALLALCAPPWIARQFGHVALSGHWFLTLALALSVSSARSGLSARRVAGFAALAVLAAGVHAYHLIPIAACFGAALVSELAQRRPRALLRVPASGALVLACVAASAWLLGYSLGLGPTGGAGALGFWSMNLTGPFWPQASRVFGQDWNGEWYPGVVDATGGQAFEGFQYLGAGVLVLIVGMTAVRLQRRGESAPVGPWLARWAPLAFAMIALSAWAVGWAVYVGKIELAQLPKPSGELAELVGGLRAHGRFFWTVGYMVTALAVAAAAKLPPRIGTSVLIAALALQAYDSGELRQGVRQVFSGPDWRAYPASLERLPEIRERSWVFYPTFYCIPSLRDLRALNQLNLLAQRTGGVSNTIGTARSTDAPCGEADESLRTDAAPGDRRITVILSAEQPRGEAMQVVAGRTDCRWFSRGVICGRDLQRVGGLVRKTPDAKLAPPSDPGRGAAP